MRPLWKDRVFDIRADAVLARNIAQENDERFTYRVQNTPKGYKVLITAEPFTVGRNQSETMKIGYLQELNEVEP